MLVHHKTQIDKEKLLAAQIQAINLQMGKAITLQETQMFKSRTDMEDKDYERRKAGADAFRNFMIGGVQSQYAAFRVIAKVFLIQETIANAQAAAMGAYKALAPIPFVGPALGIAAAAAAIAYGAARVATIAAMAEGGVVMPSAGGTLARIGEAGSKEAIIPLNDSEATREIREVLGGGSTTVNINAGVLVADDESIRELAKMLDEKLFELRRNRESVSF